MSDEILKALAEIVKNGNVGSGGVIVALVVLFYNAKGYIDTLVEGSIKTFVSEAMTPMVNEMKGIKAAIDAVDDKVDEGLARVDTRLTRVETVVEMKHGKRGSF
jgi:hypothetical protein